MAIALTDNLAFTGTTTTASTHLNTVSNGELSLVTIANSSGFTNAITSVIDSASNTYTRASSATGSGIALEIWYCLNATLSNTTTVTINPGGWNFSAVWSVFSGVATTAAYDSVVKNNASATAGTSSTVTSAASTVQANEVILCAVAQANNRPITNGAGYASINQAASSTLAEIFLEYNVVSATGSQTAASSWDLSSNWVSTIFSFADTAIGGGGGAVAHNLTMLGVGA